MPQFLLELYSEEIPARMQAQAARDLERLARERLGAAELGFEAMRTFAGPRRLTLAIDGLPAAQPDRVEDRKGPRTNAPEQALAGFLRSTGLTLEQLDVRDGAYVARLDRPGRPTTAIIAEMVEAIVRGFPWPKSMRWGSGTLRWVRPLHRILCLFDGVVVPLEIDGIVSGDATEGHRFMGDERGPFSVTGFDDYARKLAGRFVLLDAAERRRRILDGARSLCAARGLELVEDAGLLDEVAGLVEWPVPILGEMDPAFLDLPAEVISTSMRVHQRYFAVRDPATGTLAPHFVVTANIAPEDGGAVIARGNARVLSARLADARFFFDEDRRPGRIDAWLEKLKGVTFHARLGTMAERVERITALAREIAPLVGADPELAAEAARLCKADLASGMVGEFPELQGIMGGYYVRAALAEPSREEGSVGVQGASVAGEGAGGASDGAPGDPGANTPTPTLPLRGGARFTPAEVDQIADAVRDHYKPQGPSDTVPTAPVTVAVALADKLDTLVGFFAIDERPTGSRDPFALRRAALGVVRLLLTTSRRIDLARVAELAAERVDRSMAIVRAFNKGSAIESLPAEIASSREAEKMLGIILSEMVLFSSVNVRRVVVEALAFFADRLKVLLRDEGKRHDLVDAVFALGDDDLVRIVRRVEALSTFLATEDGASLLAGYRRAANILRAEAKKAPGEDYAAAPDPGAMTLPEEQALAAAVRAVAEAVDRALATEDFEAAMTGLARLRAPVDAFFDKVLVNDLDAAVRLNRLRLLGQVQATANRVADFSLVVG